MLLVLARFCHALPAAQQYVGLDQNAESEGIQLCDGYLPSLATSHVYAVSAALQPLCSCPFALQLLRSMFPVA